MNNRTMFIIGLSLLSAMFACMFSSAFTNSVLVLALAAPSAAALTAALVHFRFFADASVKSTTNEKIFAVLFTLAFVGCGLLKWTGIVTAGLLLGTVNLVIAVSLGALWGVVFVGMLKFMYRS